MADSAPIDKENFRILVVDDEDAMRTILSSLLKKHGFDVVQAEGLQSSQQLLKHQTFDLVVTDHNMPNGNGVDVLQAVRESDRSLPVIFLTAYATADLAIDVMKRGAFDFITKPFIPEAVLASVRRACKHGAILRENQRLKRAAEVVPSVSDIIGESEATRILRESIGKVAPTAATVLITGETGTGKELVARAVHTGSPRHDEPFIALNCAALPDSLLESELFGHERGAFTGADKVRQGVFEAADGGTLFLDEAGEMPLPLQAKLLRVLMEHEIVRVGSNTARKVNVRVVVATHRDLKKRVKEGLFREDLYFRLAVFPIEIAPLRKRQGDIPLLIQYFLTHVAMDLRVRPVGILPEAVDELMRYRFPGNVRELRNLIERAYILAQGADLAPEHFPLAPAGSYATGSVGTAELRQIDWVDALPDELDLRSTLEDAERRLIIRALRLESGNQTHAAKRLAISRPDLAYKIKKLSISSDEFSS